MDTNDGHTPGSKSTKKVTARVTRASSTPSTDSKVQMHTIDPGQLGTQQKERHQFQTTQHGMPIKEELKTPLSSIIVAIVRGQPMDK